MKNRWKQCLCLALSLVVLASLMPEALAQGGSSDSARRILVAMGDSYSSGEGIEPFFYQDSDIRVRIQQDDWLAHRSKKAWSGMLELPDANGSMMGDDCCENQVGTDCYGVPTLLGGDKA